MPTMMRTTTMITTTDDDDNDDADDDADDGDADDDDDDDDDDDNVVATAEIVFMLIIDVLVEANTNEEHIGVTKHRALFSSCQCTEPFYQYLSVAKQEHHCLVVNSCLHHHFLDVFAPLGDAVVLGQFNLETFILRPKRNKQKF